MNVSNIIGAAAASLIAGGIIYGAGYLVENEIKATAYVPPQPQVISPSLSPQPPSDTTVPTPGAVKAAQTTQPQAPIGIVTDPFIDCVYPHTGTLRVRKSECAGTKIDCEIAPGKWQVVWKSDCENLRQSEKRTLAGTRPTNQPIPLVDCDIRGKIYKMTKDRCSQTQEEVRQDDDIVAALEELEKSTQEYSEAFLRNYELESQDSTNRAIAKMREVGMYDPTEYNRRMEELSRIEAEVEVAPRPGQDYVCETPFGWKACSGNAVGDKPLCKTPFGYKPCSEAGVGAQKLCSTPFGIKECS